MNFLVLSRKDIESGIDIPEDFLVISITDPTDINGREQRVARIPATKNCRGIIREQFHDIEESREDGVLMDESQAKRIVRFVLDNASKVRTIVVHCEAGICRSSAVAAAFSMFFNGNDQEFFKAFIPNKRVYRLICNELFGPIV